MSPRPGTSLRGKASALYSRPGQNTRNPKGSRRAAETPQSRTKPGSIIERGQDVARQLAADPEPIVLAARCTVCQSRHGCSAGACVVCGSKAIEFLPHVDGRAA